jgi:hypothetical protein
MSAIIVTGYVPIPGHPRLPREYQELMQKLCALPVPIRSALGVLEECWLFKYLVQQDEPVTVCVGDNPQKNTLAYHIVQAQKAEWLAMASDACDADVLVWIDCGIFHLPDINGDTIVDFMRRVEGEQSIVIPGCWDQGFTYSDDHPVWRFCGGVIVMPRRYAWEFFNAVKAEYIRWIKLHNRVTWEVNTLCRVEERYPELPLWWFKADHNATMFTSYQPTGLAIN